jgi:carboxypeptidase Taq
MVRNVRWERDRAVKVPNKLVKELAEKQSLSIEAWRSARARRDYFAFRPHLETLLKRQWDFTLKLLRDMGFDLERGRQDKSTPPFTGGGAHPHHVRLSTRLYADNPLSGIMSTIHECGHGLYEQGFAPAHARTFLAQAPSFGLHESQSRFWENLVGRSHPFWSHYLPVLKASFPAELNGVALEPFWEHLNLVEPSLIRVEADEVT